MIDSEKDQEVNFIEVSRTCVYTSCIMRHKATALCIVQVEVHVQ